MHAPDGNFQNKREPLGFALKRGYSFEDSTHKPPACMI